MKKIWILVLCAGLLLSVGCQGKPTPAEPVGPMEPILENWPMPVEDYPVVDGSTATIPLSEHVMAACVDMEVEKARAMLKHNTTHEAYLALLGESDLPKPDLILVTYPSDEEFALAKEKGVELEVTPVVREGFVFLTSKENPVQGLTKQQIVDIYSGKIKNWKEVGGENAPIVAYQRPKNSGSQTGMETLVMQNATLATPPTELVMAGMGSLIDKVSAFDGGKHSLGYSYYFYATNMYTNENLKLLTVDGVAPSYESIQDQSYPYTTAYYAVLRSDEPEDGKGRKLLEFILGERGQKAAKEAGYVAIAG